jgi:peroxiredoxin
MTTIAEQVAVVAQNAAQRLPPEVLATFGADLVALDAAGIPTGVLTEGSPMPDGPVLDVEGATTTLSAVRGDRPAVLVFYRGAWCPYCNLTLKAYQEQVVPVLEAQGVQLIALSPQAPDGSLSMQEKNDLTFTVVSDPANAIAGQLGIVVMPGAQTLAAQEKIGLDAAAGNADGTAAIPMPTVVVIDAAGIVRWIDVHPNYTTRTEPAAVLAVVEARLDGPS